MHCKTSVRVSSGCSLVEPAFQMREVKYCIVSSSIFPKETSSLVSIDVSGSLGHGVQDLDSAVIFTYPGTHSIIDYS